MPRFPDQWTSRVCLGGNGTRKAQALLGLAPSTIHAALEASLRRLQTEYVDLYYAHFDDPETPLEQTLETFDELVRAGKVRSIAASNYTAPRLAEALAISDRRGLARYAALQPHYSLIARSGYEGALQALCVAEDLACVPYWGLERGFLTGKYRTGGPRIDSPRAGQASKHLDDRGRAILSALDEIASARATTVAAVALAWLRSRPAVVAPVASARTPEQLAGAAARARAAAVGGRPAPVGPGLVRRGTHPSSALARLVRKGVEFSNAVTPVPSDSFPGMVGQVTGGNPSTPASTTTTAGTTPCCRPARRAARGRSPAPRSPTSSRPTRTRSRSTPARAWPGCRAASCR